MPLGTSVGSESLPPQAVILSGPNGSGKTTAASMLLPPESNFVNADNIAVELYGQPGDGGDVNAARIVIERIRALEKGRLDFAFETTLATRSLADRVREWKNSGYQIHLFFFYLPSAEMAVQRVEGRVKAGGHFVPEETVRRRYAAGLKNLFRLYMPIVDTWRVYDNSQMSGPELIARKTHAGDVRIAQPELWERLREEACR